MPRSRTARRAALTASTISLLMACLVLTGLGNAAGAVDQPVSGSTASTDPTPTPSPDPVSKPAVGPTTLVANADSTTIEAFRFRYVTVLGNDTCSGVTPCRRSALTAMTASGPAGWPVSVVAGTGQLKIGVPSGVPAGYYAVHYSITDATGTASTYLRVRVVLGPTPDHYNPPQGAKFSHAFQRGNINRIKTHIIRTINSVPRGGQIRIITWSFSSTDYLRALVAAKKRGVSVQVILASGNNDYTISYPGLKKALGGDRWKKDATRGSWVYRCVRSCRGTGGTMHAKVFLFSQAYNTRFITMSGSGNFTDFAAKGQWNQLYTDTNNQAVYDSVNRVFISMKHDVPAKPRELALKFPTTTYFFTPMAAPEAVYDFVWQGLRQVQCTGTSIKGGRTKIRISMYTWRDRRGDWMAKQVRKLWNEGCDVRIIYAIMGNRNKAILYSPKGRGRIPMRQTIQVDDLHRPVWYLHQKYIVIGGHVGTTPTTYQVYQGSFNFSDLGMRSDENMQLLNGYSNYAPFMADFNQVWVQPETRAPNPNSYVLQEDRLGQGLYQFMEPN
ncbi:MAG: phospholipase D-like domain-containing protein [Marmoricola sp.]